MRQPQLNLWGCGLVLGLLQFAGTARAQDAVQEMATPVATPPELQESDETTPVEYDGRRYNIRWGNGGLNFSAGLQLRYIDNVFLANTGRREDFVVQPVGDVALFMPFSPASSNALVLDVGITYYQYTQNRELNTGTPIINPNSALAFNLQAGNFTIQPSEAFSYLESPVYESGADFFNVENTGRLARYNNRVGAATKWERSDWVVDGSYYHENLWANGSTFNYIDHASELLNADAFYRRSPLLSYGLEAWGSLNRFSNNSLLDSWRVRGGPAVRLNPSEVVRVRLGAGYERIDYDSGAAQAQGIEAQNSYYFYARVEQDLNQFISHSLEGSHDNLLGYNAGNLEGYHVIYSLSWKPSEPLTLSPLVSANFFHETFGTPSPDLYNERFTYLIVGATAGYQFGPHLNGSLSWAYRVKESGTSGLSYQQNQVALQVLYAF